MLALMLLIAGCESASTTTSHSGAPGQPSSTTSPSVGPSKRSTTAGFTLAFAAPQSCEYLVPVTGGLLGHCVIEYGPGYDPISRPSLIRNDGSVVSFPGPKSVTYPWFHDDGGDLVAVGTVNSTASVLLVFEPTSGAVKKAIPLPTRRPRLIGVTGTTAILARGEKGSWPMTSQVRRLDDGSALWTGAGEGLSAAHGRVGRTVLYDNAGVPRVRLTTRLWRRRAGPLANFPLRSARSREPAWLRPHRES